MYKNYIRDVGEEMCMCQSSSDRKGFLGKMAIMLGILSFLHCYL